MTLLELENMVSSGNSSLFGCGEGREEIERLMKEGECNFSYNVEDEDSIGVCVEMELTNKLDIGCLYEYYIDDEYNFNLVKNLEIKIIDVWEH